MKTYTITVNDDEMENLRWGLHAAMADSDGSYDDDLIALHNKLSDAPYVEITKPLTGEKKRMMND